MTVLISVCYLGNILIMEELLHNTARLERIVDFEIQHLDELHIKIKHLIIELMGIFTDTTI